MSISERLKIFIDSVGTRYQVSQKTGIHQSQLGRYYSGNDIPSHSTLEKIFTAYPQLNREWLIAGKGAMLTHEGSKHVNSIPFYEVTAMGGTGRGFPDDITPHQLITLPHRLQADVCILVGGDSMAPAYTPGDVIALRKVRGEHIHYGSAYMIETEDGCLLKYIRKASQDTHVRLVSENPAYDAYDIPKDAITGLWLVVGVWKRKEL